MPRLTVNGTPLHANIPVAFAVVNLLDDLDIAACAHCEELRYALIDWLHAHSDRIATRRRSETVFDLLPIALRNKHSAKAEALI